MISVILLFVLLGTSHLLLRYYKMVKGGTIYRKSASKRFEKRKCPARNANVNMVVESENDGPSLMEIDEEVPGTSIENITVSESKVEQIVNSEENNKPTGYRFVDLDIMTILFCYCLPKMLLLNIDIDRK